MFSLLQYIPSLRWDPQKERRILYTPTLAGHSWLRNWTAAHCDYGAD
jgi:hypothetical protein